VANKDYQSQPKRPEARKKPVKITDSEGSGFQGSTASDRDGSQERKRRIVTVDCSDLEDPSSYIIKTQEDSSVRAFAEHFDLGNLADADDLDDAQGKELVLL